MENKITKRRREVENLILILIFLLFFYTLLIPTIRLIRIYIDLKKMKNEIEDIKIKIDRLNKEIEFYSSDEGIERWIKENFKLTGDNEKIYIFPDN